MSVASQSNDRLGMLVTLVGRIEGYLSSEKKSKGGKGGAEGKDESKKLKALSGAVVELVKAVNKVDEKAGDKFKGFMGKVGDAITKFSKDVKDEDIDKIKIVTSLGSSMAKFALGLVAIGLLAPLVALGALVFSLSIRAIISIVGDGSLSKKTQGTMEFILGLGKSIAIYALGMVAIALLSPLVALGTLTFILSVGAIILVFNALGSLSKTKTNALTSILELGKSIALYALGMVAIALLSPLVALGTLTIVLSVLAISLALKAVDGKKTASAATSLKKLLLPIALLAAVLFIVGLAAETIAIGALVMSLAIVGLGLAAYVLGKFDKDIKKGAGALTALAVPLILFSVALTILSRGVTDPPGLLFAKLGAIAASIVGLGLAAYVLGLPAVFPFVMLGALALTALALPFIMFSGALFVLSKVKFEPGQFDALGDNLKKLTTAFVDAFADLSLSDMLAIAAGIVLTTGMAVAVATLAMGVQKMANLEVVDYEVKNGKIVPKSTRKLTEQDFENAGKNVGAILTTLIKPLTEFGKASRKGTGEGFMSFFTDGYMEDGIELASTVGDVISTLAKGVADMANLNVIDYEVVGAGTKDAKLVPKGSRHLTDDDFRLAGEGTGKILTALIKPLTEFGKASREGQGEGWMSFFQDGYMQEGVELSSKVAGTIANLSKGVADMANLTVTEYEVVGAGTKDAKLVPKGSRRLQKEDFELAGVGVGKILSALIKPLTDFGYASENGKGWFEGGYLEKGIEAAAGVSQPLSAMVEAIKAIAGGNVIEQEVVGKGKDRKVVPKAATPFIDLIPKAKKGINDLFYAFIHPLTSIGKYYNDNWISISGGISAIEKMSENVPASVVKIVESLSKVSAQLATLNVLDAGQGLQEVLSGLGYGLSSFSKPISDLGEDDIEEKLKPLIDQLLRINAKFIEPFASFNNSFAMFAKNLSWVAMTLQKLAFTVNPFEKFVKSFSVFSKDVGVFVRSWEMFGKDNDTYWTNFSKNIKLMAEVDTKKLAESAKIVSEMAKQQLTYEKERPQETRSLVETVGDTITKALSFGEEKKKEAAPTAAPTKQQPIDYDALANAIVNALKRSTLRVSVDDGGGKRFSGGGGF